MAEEAGRRVVYLRWGQEFKPVPLEELLSRNMLRLTKMGRYIPALSIKVGPSTPRLLCRIDPQDPSHTKACIANYRLSLPADGPGAVAAADSDVAERRPVAADVTGGLFARQPAHAAALLAAPAPGPRPRYPAHSGL
jgi:hypothetical protein